MKFRYMLPMLMIAAASSQAQVATTDSYAGEGTRGGGEVVTVNDRKELRDLYATTVCEWISGSEMLQSSLYLKGALSRIGAVDWYFSYDLERSIRSLEWCMTGKLIKVKTEDKDALTIAENIQAEQVAIRLVESNEVYVDENLYKQMSERSKAFLIIHETIHSYLKVDEKRRNEKLRSFVKVLAKIDGGSMNSRDELNLAIYHNDIQYNGNVEILDAYKDFVLYALGSADEKRTILAAQTDVANYLDTSKQYPLFKDGLTESDKVMVGSLNPVSDFAKLCKGSGAFAEKMFDGTHTLSSELAVAAVASIQDNAKLKSKILSSHYFTARISDIIEQVGSIRASIVSARVSVPSIIKFMATLPTYGVDTVEVLALDTMYSDKDFMSSPVAAGLYVYVQNLVQSGNWEKLANVITDNQKFYIGFSLDQLVASIATLDAPVAREKSYAITNMIRIKKQFWTLFLQKLAAETDPVNYAKFESMLDQSKLGLK